MLRAIGASTLLLFLSVLRRIAITAFEVVWTAHYFTGCIVASELCSCGLKWPWCNLEAIRGSVSSGIFGFRDQPQLKIQTSCCHIKSISNVHCTIIVDKRILDDKPFVISIAKISKKILIVSVKFASYAFCLFFSKLINEYGFKWRESLWS